MRKVGIAKSFKQIFAGVLTVFSLGGTCWAQDHLVYEGTSGPGVGKHIVWIAADHEYRSEESLPALARIMAKHHGFRCTVLFSVDETSGAITPGNSNIPGLEALKTADLMVNFSEVSGPSRRTDAAHR